jgi:hypothetical protein
MRKLLLRFFGYSEDVDAVDAAVVMIFDLMFLLFAVVFQFIDYFLLPTYSFIVANCITEVTFSGSCSAGFEVSNNGCLDVLSAVVT